MGTNDYTGRLFSSKHSSQNIKKIYSHQPYWPTKLIFTFGVYVIKTDHILQRDYYFVGLYKMPSAAKLLSSVECQ